ncbi:MAG: cation diffusion facilitator family transporter [Asticcacaulis sp.]
MVLTGFVLTFGFMIAEVIGGVLSGSLALIADAGHMLTDAAALALAWAGFRFGRKASNARKTFGYMRFEVLAGFVNALTLLGLVVWIAWEAVTRLLNPQPILSGPMLVVATLGLAVNILVFYILSRGDKEHVNIKGALLHVLGDLLGSVAAIAAALIIYATGWTPIDPILSVLLSALILRSGWALLKNSLHILMEGTPVHIDIAQMQTELPKAVEGLISISHVHVWSITSGKVAATLEARIDPEHSPAKVLTAIKRTLAEVYKIDHTTVEINWDDSPDCPLSPQGHGH